MTHRDLPFDEPVPAYGATGPDLERLLRADRMECLAALTTGLTHALSNLLASTLMSVGLLLRTAPEGVQRQLLGSLQAMTREGLDLVRQLHGIARGVEGEAIVFQPQYLMVEIQKLWNACLPTLPIITRYPAELWPVAGDPQHFVQLVLALCLEGAHGIPPGEAMVLSATNVETASIEGQGSQLGAAGRRIAIQVEPRAANGPPRAAESAVEAKADDAPSFRSRPTEIRISLARPSHPIAALAAAMGGTYEAPAAAEGKAARINLPAAGSHAAGAARTGEPPSGGGESVLIFEDDPLLASTLCEVLASYGYCPVVARSGDEAGPVPEPGSEYLDGPADLALVAASLDDEGHWRLAPAARRADLPLVLMIDAETADRLDRQAPGPRRGIKPRAVLRKPFTIPELLFALAPAGENANEDAEDSLGTPSG